MNDELTRLLLLIVLTVTVMAFVALAIYAVVQWLMQYAMIGGIVFVMVLA